MKGPNETETKCENGKGVVKIFNSTGMIHKMKSKETSSHTCLDICDKVKVCMFIVLPVIVTFWVLFYLIFFNLREFYTELLYNYST